MKEDPFIVECERLRLDFYKVAGLINRSDTYHKLAQALDIKHKDAEKLWETYWQSFNDN